MKEMFKKGGKHKSLVVVYVCSFFLWCIFLTDPAFATLTFSGGVKITGNLTITGAISKSAGTFLIDHPLDPKNKLLYHSFVESPDVKNIYDGVATLDANGEATIELPRYFEALNREYRYQYSAIGESMPNLHVSKKIENNKFAIGGGTPNGTISWQVTGNRQDAYILENPIVTEVAKSPTALKDRGQCIYEPLCE